MRRSLTSIVCLAALLAASEVAAELHRFRILVRERGAADYALAIRTALSQPLMPKVVAEFCEQEKPAGLRPLSGERNQPAGFQLEQGIAQVEVGGSFDDFLRSSHGYEGELYLRITRSPDADAAPIPADKLIAIYCQQMQRAINEAATHDWQFEQQELRERYVAHQDMLHRAREVVHSLDSQIRKLLDSLGAFDETAVRESLLDARRRLDAVRLEQIGLQSRRGAMEMQIQRLAKRAELDVVDDEIVRNLELVVSNREAILKLATGGTRVESLEAESALARARIELAQARRQAAQGARLSIDKFNAELAENEVDLAEITEREKYLAEREKQGLSIVTTLRNDIEPLRKELARAQHRQDECQNWTDRSHDDLQAWARKMPEARVETNIEATPKANE